MGCYVIKIDFLFVRTIGFIIRTYRHIKKYCTKYDYIDTVRYLNLMIGDLSHK